MPTGVPVFAIPRRILSGDAVLKVCRQIVIAVGRVVLEYGIDAVTPGEARDVAGESWWPRLAAEQL
jgi:hypothetical protein